MLCPYCESDNVRDLGPYYHCKECDHNFIEGGPDYGAYYEMRQREQGRARAANRRRYGRVTV